MSALFLGIETAGTGTHPASWRRTDSRAEDLFTAGYWTDVVTTAEALGFDAVFLPDSFAVQDGGPGVTRGRLDAVAVAARTAPLTHRIGLVPQVPVTHTEPFHVSKAIAALDFASLGRAGWEVTVSTGETEAAAFGRKKIQDAASLWHEADEAVEVVTRLWDSWEDDAEIRDVPTGRFIDRDRLHYIDFEGDNFSVKGPAITPRSPQGQPIVALRADDPPSTEVAVRRADLIRITAPDLTTAATHRLALRAALTDAGRDPDAVRVLLDLPVHQADSAASAHADVAELDRWAQRRPGQHARADRARDGLDQREAAGSDHSAAEGRLRHVGTVAELDELLAEIARSGIDGVVLQPLALHATLSALTGHRAPSATPTERGAFRDRLGLPRPVSRYAAGAAL
ncbi:LLM class flavin-dependent oxidoreductase [Nocardia caishijiensis]|uniref:Alkanesulfonate monooxygenase SsuD/methylene tetrahydromethanopterin reductase-like flavin-dependent oxidoreductase (Luciferase family) n=1 Tax=Nocardia caishijiensis TaxID=184756 RepID=A0ABQ6YFT1_9NOCA|nr:LLM class flavin-dependent oxidoreductase [Nocardia caishijiensis]KAF0842471.1 alkanesulfonate monooxygenase SsuD/methylene tetrahydromethanopterin reductase-like flavin-dependent oxidoreductase (luciferase family) [Nocardia caishijiensis]